jgi:carboxymethylenebutenolidase
MIEFGKRKDAGTGYLARSERVGPCVLVLHEFFGLTQAFKDMADDLNAEGFTVLAPDLYDGKIASSVEEAKELSGALDEETVMLRLKAASEHLTSNWHPRLGAVGFSLGADLALSLATRRELEAVVVYYGLWGVEPGKWRTPLLGHFADKDEWVDQDAVEKVFPALADGGVDAEFHVYPGTGHWFANPDVADSYHPEAAGSAWDRTVDFLTHHLA